MEMFKYISLKSEMKRKKIERIYFEISLGMSNKSLTMDSIKEKINEAGKLIREIEKIEYKTDLSGLI